MRKEIYTNFIYPFFTSIIIIAILLFLSSLINFETLKYIYFTTVILGIIHFALSKNQSDFRVFFFSFAYFLPWLVYGIDLTDEAYSLTLSWYFPNIKQFGSLGNSFAYALTKTWLGIAGGPFLLWERVFGAVVIATTIFFAYKIAKLYGYKQKNKLFDLLLIFSAATVSFNAIKFLVPYDKIPVMLATAMIYFFLKAFESHKAEYFTLGGLLLVLLVYSRITAFIMIILPVFLFLKYKPKLREIKWIALGVISGFAILLSVNIKPEFPIEAIKIKLFPSGKILCIANDSTHSQQFLMNKYMEDIWHTGIYMLYFALASLPLVIMPKSQKKYTAFWALVLSIVLLTVGIKEFTFDFTPSSTKWFYASFSIILLLYLYGVIKDLTEKKFNAELHLAILLLLVLSFAGSNVGVRKFYYSGAVSMMFFVALTKTINRLPKILMVSILIFISIISTDFAYNSVYRDYRYKQLNGQFSTKYLRGIKTKQEKVAEIEDFTQKLKQTNGLDSNYIIINKAYTFALLSEKTPYSVCWLTDTAKLLNSIESYGKPEYIIFSTRNLRKHKWDLDTTFTAESEKNIILACKRLTDSLYKPVTYSKDSIFVLYRLKQD